MSQASQLSRWNHPVLLSLAGFGTAYGIYALWNAYSYRTTSAALHRSNAVHRPRVAPSHGRVDHTDPTAEAPLGMIVVTRGEETLSINILTSDIPTAEHFTSRFGPAGEDLRGEVQTVVLSTILSRCFHATNDPEYIYRDVLEQLGFGHLMAAFDSRDEQRVRRSAWDVPFFMDLDSIDAEQIDRFVSMAVNSRFWLRDTASNLAETEDLDVLDGSRKEEPSQGLHGLLYYIAEENAKRKSTIHHGIRCEGCGSFPITGVRYKCLNCPDFDLCSSCEAQLRHPKTHVFAKVVVPLPLLSQPTHQHPLWYPGDPERLHHLLDHALKKRLSQETELDEPNIDALYEQFTANANVHWQQDPSKVRAAIDRRAFNKALTSERWSKSFTTNAIYDRMFAFYDADNNGLIDFEEFVGGIAYLRGPRRFASLHRALKGFDIDDDGHVDRTDLLRLLHAKYQIQKQLVADAVQGQEMDQTIAGIDTLRSSQPISSIFAMEEIPRGGTNRPRGKLPDINGDLLPRPETQTVLENDDPFPSDPVRSAREVLQSQLSSRLGEMGYDGRVEIPTETPALNASLTSSIGEERETSLSNSLNEIELDEPFIQDILWHDIEERLNILLNPLFDAREKEDQSIIATREERTKWREEIDVEVAAQQQFRDHLVATAATEPLVATAMVNRDAVLPPLPERVTTTTGGMVPTDWEQLSRREEEIADARLDELLESLGYGIRDVDENQSSRGGESFGAASSSDSYTRPDRGEDPTEAHSDSLDPTLPQNKPSAVSASKATTTGVHDVANMTAENGAPLSKDRLQVLVRLHNLESELEQRGGPGRLTYDEAESIIVAQNRVDLRGLVKGWLEFAAF